MIKKFYKLGLIFGLLMCIQSKVQAANGADFKSGRIIDDAIFYDGDSMSAADIQNWLNDMLDGNANNGVNKQCDTNGTQSITYRYNSSTGRVDTSPDPFVSTSRSTYGQRLADWRASQDLADLGTRAPFICLKDYIENPSTRDNNLDGSVSGGISAAQIIWNESQTYNINPRVLLVLIQKESVGGMLTDDWPFDYQYKTITGYGCPDGAPCDSQYYGFYNQIHNAARQFRLYANNPGDYNYIAGQNNNILYHPINNCGYQTVFIENQATGGLYNYTPYVPNQAALNNLYGTGDSCSSYGNRNFWRFWTDWFGSPTIDPNKDQRLVGDWDGDGKDTPGIRRGNQYFLDYDNDGDADAQFGFGLDSDISLVGDWDGDGSDEIGLKRGERYYFSYDFNGTSEIYQGYGNATDQAIVGDWDGDGRDEIGLKRGNRFYLNFNYDGSAELYIGFGEPTDGVFVGDWDGDGDDNLALRRGVRYIFDFGHDGITDADFGYGSSYHSVVVGDWDGDGRDSMGLKNGEFYYLDNNLDGKTEIYTGIGQRTDVGLIGDWDGDGRDTIGIKRGRNFFLDNTNDGRAEVYIYYNY
jgi:hypothetical protein